MYSQNARYPWERRQYRVTVQLLVHLQDHPHLSRDQCRLLRHLLLLRLSLLAQDQNLMTRCLCTRDLRRLRPQRHHYPSGQDHLLCQAARMPRLRNPPTAREHHTLATKTVHRTPRPMKDGLARFLQSQGLVQLSRQGLRLHHRHRCRPLPVARAQTCKPRQCLTMTNEEKATTRATTIQTLRLVRSIRMP